MQGYGRITGGSERFLPIQLHAAETARSEFLPIVVTVGNKSRVSVSVQSPVVAVMVLSGELKVWNGMKEDDTFDCQKRQGF